jgi:hypothetical protein
VGNLLSEMTWRSKNLKLDSLQIIISRIGTILSGNPLWRMGSMDPFFILFKLTFKVLKNSEKIRDIDNGAFYGPAKYQ